MRTKNNTEGDNKLCTNSRALKDVLSKDHIKLGNGVRWRGSINRLMFKWIREEGRERIDLRYMHISI